MIIKEQILFEIFTMAIEDKNFVSLRYSDSWVGRIRQIKLLFHTYIE